MEINHDLHKSAGEGSNRSGGWDGRDRQSVSIERRVEQLYAQSGGPEMAAERIAALMKQHLLRGKDHGKPGRMETVGDVLRELFREDRSLQGLAQWSNKLSLMALQYTQSRIQHEAKLLQLLEEQNRILESGRDG